jgi:hypothetical protein
MPWYRTPDGAGSMHVNFGRKAGPVRCAAPALDTDNLAIAKKCLRLSVALCDAPVGYDTCDMPICEHHRIVGGKNVDYCPRHQHLAPPALPLGK